MNKSPSPGPWISSECPLQREDQGLIERSRGMVSPGGILNWPRVSNLGPKMWWTKTDKDVLDMKTILPSDPRKANRLFFLFVQKTNVSYTFQQNGESHKQSWLLYSPPNGSVNCFCCTLMSSLTDKFSHSEGFGHWKKSWRENEPPRWGWRVQRFVRYILRSKGSCHHADSQLEKEAQQK